MKHLNLSGDEETIVASNREKCAVRVNNVRAIESEKEIVSRPSTTVEFCRKYNGIKKKRRMSLEKWTPSKVFNENKMALNSKLNDASAVPLPNIIKASIGVQTSLESLNKCCVAMEDKSCQVSSPLLNKILKNTTTSNSYTTSPSVESDTSLEENNKSEKIKNAFEIHRNSRKFFFNADNRERPGRRSLSPISRSYVMTQSNNNVKLKQGKKRSYSENEAKISNNSTS